MDNIQRTSDMQSMSVNMRQIFYRLYRTGSVFTLKTIFAGEPISQVLNLQEVPNLDYTDPVIADFCDLYLCQDPRFVRILDNALIGAKRRFRDYELEKMNFIYELIDSFILHHTSVGAFEDAIILSVERTFLKNWILVQSSRKSFHLPSSASRPLSSRQIRRAIREVIQRESALTKSKDAAKAASSKQKKKARDIEIRKARDEIQKQSGFLDSVKGLMMTPFTISETVQKTSALVENLDKTAEEVQRCLRTFEESAAVVGETAKTYGDIPGNVSEASDSLFRRVSEIIKSIGKSLKEILPALLIKCLLAAFCLYLLQTINIPIFKIGFLVIVGLVLGDEIRQHFVEYFYVDNELNEEIVQQSGGSCILSQLMASIVLGAVFAGKKPSSFTSLFSSVSNAVSAAPRTIKGVDSIFELVVSIFETIFNTIRGWMGAAPVQFISKWKKELGDLVEKVHLAEYEEASGKHTLNPAARYTRILALLREVQVQKATFATHNEIKRVLDDLHRILVRISASLRATAGDGVGYRVQPASLILSGKPGIGKTNMTQMIALTCMRLTGDLPERPTPQEAAQSIFTKPENSPYMDGYNGQYCYLIDDLFAILPNPNAETSQFADLMTYYGSFTAQLNMANCESKGMYPFTSKLILMTTNCNDLHSVRASQILLEPEAFARRIDFHYEISVKPEFRKPNSHELCFDLFKKEEAKMSGKTVFTSYPWHIWECFPTRFGSHSPGVPGNGISMMQVIKELASKIIQNKKFHLTTLDAFQSILTAPLDDDVIVEQSGGEIDTEEFQDASSDSDDDSVCNEHPEPSYYASIEYQLPPVFTAAGILKEEDKASDDLATSTASTWSEHLSAIGLILGTIDTVFQDNAACWAALSALCLLFTFATFKLIRSFAKLVMGIISGAYNWVKDFFYPASDVLEPQSNGPKGTVVRFKTQTQSGGEEKLGNKPLWEIVYENTYKLAIEYNQDRYCVLGQILFLKDFFAVMPMHFFDDILEKKKTGNITGDTVLLLRGCAKNNHRIRVSVSVFLSLEKVEYRDKDLVFVSFGKTMTPRKDITKFVLKQKQIRDLGSSAVRLDTARMQKNGELIDYNERATYFAPSVEVGKVDKIIGLTRHTSWLRYSALTERGDCGAVLTVQDHNRYGCRLIAGLHVGFQPSMSKAYATILDTETCEEALSHFRTFSPVEMSFRDTVLQAGGDLPGRFDSVPADTLPFGDGTFGSFEPLDIVSEPVSNPIMTSLQETIVKGLFDEDIKEFYNGAPVAEMRPVKLKSYKDEEGNVVFPMETAMKPFAGDTLIVDTKAFKKAVTVALQPFNKASCHSIARKLSFEEAVLGVPGLGLKSITRKTSVGYPHCVLVSNKSAFFGDGDEYDLTTDAALSLKREVHALEDAILEGKRPYFIARDFLKDEVRKVGKTARLIAGTDVRYYILCRMYFGAFVAAMVEQHQKAGTCVGMNPYTEWSWLREHLTKRGDKVWDGDFAGFDSLQQPSMLWCICDVINSWYAQRDESEGNRAREILFYDLAHSRHLAAAFGCANTVFQWQKSLPSGHFLTATVNSILSMSCIVAAGIELTKNEDFWSYASAATLGDDNVANCSDEYIDVFNQVTTAKFVKDKYGMEYTAGRKGEELKPYMGIEDVIFLQRQFRRKNDKDVCPIRPESFLTSLYYSKKGSVEYRKEVLVSGLENALEELSMHSEDMWKKISPKLIKLMSNADASPQLDITSSSDYLDRVLTRVPIWI